MLTKMLWKHLFDKVIISPEMVKITPSVKIIFCQAKHKDNNNDKDDKDAVNCFKLKKYAHKIVAVPLSNDTVSRRIRNIFNYIEERILKDISGIFFHSS